MIKLIKSFPYDNSYDYVKMFSNKLEQESFFNTFDYENIDEHNYIKIQNSFNINYSYDFLENEGVNYVIFDNGYRDIFAFIVKKEYIREEVTKIIFEVDVIQTYMFDFLVKNSFIERKKCLINEISDFDEGLNIGEHIIEQRTVVIEKTTQWFAMFNGFREQHLIYNENGKLSDVLNFQSTISKPMTLIDNIQYPLYFLPLPTGKLPYALSDHPSLVGIVRFPSCTFSTQEVRIPILIEDNIGEKGYINAFYEVDMATEINSQSITGGSVSVPKSDITDFFPYTYYVLTDGESEPVIMHPQYINGSITVKGQFSLSHNPVERYYPVGYKGDNTGKIYNITNANQMMLPTGTNEGSNFLNANANSVMQNRKSQITSNIINGVTGVATTIGSIATGNVMGAVSSALSTGGSIANGINEIKNLDARNKDIEMTPNTITSYGTPSTRYAFDTNNVEVIKYTVKENVKDKIRNFCNRYGNKFNNYGVIDFKTYKGYIKFISPDIDSKIDNIYIYKLREILERGVFIE